MPRIKKSIKAFLLEEDGTISKKAVVSIGSALTIGAALSAQEAQAGMCGKAGTRDHWDHCWDHSNAINTQGTGTAVGHQHHYNHGSHGSHSSHSSHGSSGKGT